MIQDVLIKAFLNTQEQVVDYRYFATAEDALEVLKEQDLENIVVLLDIFMPGLNGFDFLEMACASHLCERCKLKVYMLTSSVLNEDRQRAETYACVQGYIVKPLMLTQLQELLLELDVVKDTKHKPT